MAPFNCIYDYQFSDEATTEPVTLSEVKNWLRVDGADDDTLLTNLIKAARILLEHYLNQSIIKRTVTATLNNSCGNIFLPFQPFDGADVDSIKNYDNVDIATGNYKLDGSQFKKLQYPCEDNITVVYKTGLTLVAQNIKTAIMQQVAFMYENRGDETKNIDGAVSSIVKINLKSYRR